MTEKTQTDREKFEAFMSETRGNFPGVNRAPVQMSAQYARRLGIELDKNGEGTYRTAWGSWKVQTK
jgi:hypothetical protein